MYRTLLIAVLAVLGGVNGIVIAFQHPPLGAKATDIAVHAAHGQGHDNQHLNGTAQHAASNGSSVSVGIIAPLNPATATVSTPKGQQASTPSSSKAVQRTASSRAVKSSSAVPQATQSLAVEILPSGSNGLIPLVILTDSKGGVATVTEGSETIVVSELNGNQATPTPSSVAAVSIIIVSDSSTVTVRPSSKVSSASAPGRTGSTSVFVGSSNAVVTAASTPTPTTLVTSAVAASKSLSSAGEDNQDACQCTCACPSGSIIQGSTASAVVSAVAPQSTSKSSSIQVVTTAPLTSGTSIVQKVSTSSVGETSTSETSSAITTAPAIAASDKPANVNINTLEFYSALTIALGG